jgi:hypothetical protein
MQSIIQTIMSFATRWWIISVGLIAVAAFAQAVIEGEVTFQDALIALCVTTVAMVETIKEHRWLGAAGAAGGVAGSYLWLANGAETSPVEGKFVALVVLTFLVALLAGLGPSVVLSRSSNTVQTVAMALTSFLAVSGAIWLVLRFLLR